MKKFTLILVAIVAGTYLYNQQSELAPPEANPSPVVEEIVQEETNSQLILTATENGQTALDLLNKNVEIETKDYGDAGMFVTGIDGLVSDNEHYWAFYVNDEYAQQGVSQTVLESGDIVKFTYEEITPAEL